MSDEPPQAGHSQSFEQMAAQAKPAGSTWTALRSGVAQLVEQALPGCSPETYLFLADRAHDRAVHHGEMISRHDEQIQLTLISRGYGAFRRTTVDGQQLIFGIARPGELVGFASIATTHASVDLVALTECDVVQWRSAELRPLVAIDPGFALAVIAHLAAFTNAITESIDGFLHQNARRRVVRVLDRHRDLLFATPAILSRSYLPSLVGTSREMTGRVMRELEREGTLARVGRNGLSLLRPDQLDADAAHSSGGAPVRRVG
jgi:CRP-like cAMP-binding protein